MNQTAKIHWVWIAVLIACLFAALAVAGQRITTVHCSDANAPAACRP